MAIMALAGLAAAVAQSVPVKIALPVGELAGTYVPGNTGGPVVVIVPGSGPTDRDGNSTPLVKAAPYRMLADALKLRGIGSIRFDKRGLFESKSVLARPDQVTIADYAADVHRWAAKASALAAAKCAWVAGHSEGALVALAAAQDRKGICGVISIAGPGRKLGLILLDQLQSNPANAPILPQALNALDTLEHGGSVDEQSLPAPLRPLFKASLQPYLRDLLSYDPATLASRLRVPFLVLQGDKDIQVSIADAQSLAKAKPNASLDILPNTNHVLKEVTSADRTANIATYSDPDRPLARGVADRMTSFITAHAP
ncbi:MAG TPA: alpha/beta hydrolase [Sphingomicrobium sp.]|nr:alpha/beta hydrolase [Sphingomicrobium sp.]